MFDEPNDGRLLSSSVTKTLCLVDIVEQCLFHVALVPPTITARFPARHFLAMAGSRHCVEPPPNDLNVHPFSCAYFIMFVGRILRNMNDRYDMT